MFEVGSSLSPESPMAHVRTVDYHWKFAYKPWQLIHDPINQAEAKIVIVMEESEAASLHPAVLSRVSILHSALLKDSSKDSLRSKFFCYINDVKGLLAHFP